MSEILDDKKEEGQTEGCLWVRDVDDWFSATAKRCIDYIRKVCQCPECVERRKSNG